MENDGKVYLRLKLRLKENMTTIFGKDRRLCKIEANAIIYSNWVETFMLQTIIIFKYHCLIYVKYFGLGTKE